MKIILDLDNDTFDDKKLEKNNCEICKRPMNEYAKYNRTIKSNINNDIVRLQFCDDYCLNRYVYNSFYHNNHCYIPIEPRASIIKREADQCLRHMCVCGANLKSTSKHHDRHYSSERHRNFIKNMSIKND